mgnify:CR=1 FL=1
MLNIIVCIKQVPMVSELPWDSKTGTLKRELAQGMMDPASRRALEAALKIKEQQPACISAVSMGPCMAEEVLHQAKALGADKGFLLTDRKMAGADTFITTQILGRAIEKACTGFDLVLRGCHTSDSKTAQVGPQLAERLAVAVRTRFDATLGLAVAGSSEPTPRGRGGDLSVVVAGPEGASLRELHYPIDRERFRVLAAHAALSRLRGWARSRDRS